MWFLLHKCLHRAGLQLVCICPRMLSKQKKVVAFFFFFFLNEESLGSNTFRLSGSQLPLDFSRANHWLPERKQWSSAPLADAMHLLTTFSSKLTMKNIKK